MHFVRNQKLIESLLQSQENPKSDSPKQVGRFKIPAGWRLLPLAKCYNQEETPYLSLSFKRRKVPFIHLAPHIFQWRYTEAWLLSWHSWKSVVPAQYSCPGKNKDSGLSWQTPLFLFPAQHRVDRQKMIFSASPLERERVDLFIKHSDFSEAAQRTRFSLVNFESLSSPALRQGEVPVCKDWRNACFVQCMDSNKESQEKWRIRYSKQRYSKQRNKINPEKLTLVKESYMIYLTENIKWLSQRHAQNSREQRRYKLRISTRK